MKRFTAFVLALILCLSLLPVMAFASGVTSVTVAPPDPSTCSTIVDYFDAIQVTNGGTKEGIIGIWAVDPSGNEWEIEPSNYTDAIPANQQLRVRIMMSTTDENGYPHDAQSRFTGEVQGVTAHGTSVTNMFGVGIMDTSTVGKFLIVCYDFTLTSTHKHSVGTKNEATDATCTEAGTVEWYSCTDPTCEAYLDADGKALESIVDPAKPATGHEFSEAWSTDADNHWHAAICEHTTEKSDSAAHTDVSEKDHHCDVCGYVMSECKDEDGNNLCDICGKDLTEPEPEPECKLPGFIGWIVNSMLRVVRLIIARITFEKYEPVIIGGAIVKIVWDAFAR